MGAENIESQTAKLYEDIHPYEVVEASIIDYLGTLQINAEYFRGKRVIDCGFGGTGWASELFARSGAGLLAGVDLNRRWCVEITRRLSTSECPKLFAQANVLSLPYKDGTFDYAHSFGVMHHTTDWRKGMSEMARVLRPGGTLFVMVYGRFGLLGEAMRVTYRTLGKVVPYRFSAWFVKTTGLMRNPRLSILDAMYVPIEEHVTEEELTGLLRNLGLIHITRFENAKWRGKLLAHPLLFGPKLNHNVWAVKPQ